MAFYGEQHSGDADMSQEPRIRLRRRHFRQEVYSAAQAMLNEQPAPSAAEIADRLEIAFPSESVPRERSVSDWIARGVIVPDDQDGPWHLTDATAEDIPLVLGVARAMIEASADPKWKARHSTWPTKAVAEWIIRLRRAYPELKSSVRTYQLAYLARHSDGRWIETTLAYTPWLDQGAALASARKRGVLPEIDDDMALLKTMVEAFA
jgi:hypothetical protein